MTYRGKVKNGVVVLEGNAALEEGTIVRVEPEELPKPPKRGRAEAIMQAIRSGAHWEGDPAEVDRFLAERKQEKRAEVQAQLEQWRQESEQNPLGEE